MGGSDNSLLARDRVPPISGARIYGLIFLSDLLQVGSQAGKALLAAFAASDAPRGRKRGHVREYLRPTAEDDGEVK